MGRVCGKASRSSYTRLDGTTGTAGDVFLPSSNTGSKTIATPDLPDWSEMVYDQAASGADSLAPIGNILFYSGTQAASLALSDSDRFIDGGAFGYTITVTGDGNQIQGGPGTGCRLGGRTVDEFGGAFNAVDIGPLGLRRENAQGHVVYRETCARAA